MLRAQGANIPISAKIEKPKALAHLEEIMPVADGVMVALGDLAVELSLEEAPTGQKRIISLAGRRGVLVIKETGMLESMVSNPMPSQAEASEVANAVFDGNDAVLTSAETTIGAYPVETVRTMERILRQAEEEGP